MQVSFISVDLESTISYWQQFIAIVLVKKKVQCLTFHDKFSLFFGIMKIKNKVREKHSGK